MSSHGCTVKVAHQIAAQLSGEIRLVNLRNHRDFKPADYDRIIIGGSIHAGKIQKRLRDYCLANQELLLQKEIGLFICCLFEDEQAWKQLYDSFPEELYQHAKSLAIMGGEARFECMNFVERYLMRSISGQKESFSRIKTEAIQSFSGNMEKTIPNFLQFH